MTPLARKSKAKKKKKGQREGIEVKVLTLSGGRLKFAPQHHICPHGEGFLGTEQELVPSTTRCGWQTKPKQWPTTIKKNPLGGPERWLTGQALGAGAMV